MTKSESASQVTGPDTICHQWRKRAVTVDRVSGIIEFRHCHVARQSLVFARTQPYFACSTADLRAVHFTPHFKNTLAFLTVVTTTGKAIVPDTGTHFATLRDWFTETVPTNDPEFATDNPLIAFAYVFVGMVSFFTAAFLSEGAGNAVMFVAAVFGAVFGVIGTHLLVHFGGRLVRTDITYGMIGIVPGLAISAALGLFIGWNTALSVGIVLTGALIGVMCSAGRRSNGRTKP